MHYKKYLHTSLLPVELKFRTTDALKARNTVSWKFRLTGTVLQ